MASAKAGGSTLHAASQTCATEDEWMDYNRFINDQCLSFASRSDGGISVSLAEMPTRPEGKVVMDIGVDETKLVTFDKDKKEWVTRWKSTDNLALVWASLRSLARLVCKRCQELHAFNPMSYMFFFVRTSCVHKIDCLVFEPEFPENGGAYFFSPKPSLDAIDKKGEHQRDSVSIIPIRKIDGEDDFMLDWLF